MVVSPCNILPLHGELFSFTDTYAMMSSNNTTSSNVPPIRPSRLRRIDVQLALQTLQSRTELTKAAAAQKLYLPLNAVLDNAASALDSILCYNEWTPKCREHWTPKYCCVDARLSNAAITVTGLLKAAVTLTSVANFSVTYMYTAYAHAAVLITIRAQSNGRSMNNIRPEW